MSSSSLGASEIDGPTLISFLLQLIDTLANGAGCVRTQSDRIECDLHFCGGRYLRCCLCQLPSCVCEVEHYFDGHSMMDINMILFNLTVKCHCALCTDGSGRPTSDDQHRAESKSDALYIGLASECPVASNLILDSSCFGHCRSLCSVELAHGKWAIIHWAMPSVCVCVPVMLSELGNHKHKCIAEL